MKKPRRLRIIDQAIRFRGLAELMVRWVAIFATETPHNAFSFASLIPAAAIVAALICAPKLNKPVPATVTTKAA